MSGDEALIEEPAVDTPRIEVPVVHDTPLLRAWFVEGTGDRLVLSFSGIGNNHREVPAIELFGASRDEGRNHVLFLSDPERTWMNAPGLPEEIVALAQTYQARTGATRVATLGNSMGGFSALVLPSLMPIETAVAFAPQFSVHPDLASADPRWQRWRKRIHEYRFRSVGEHMVAGTRYYAIHGNKPRELVQRTLFEGLPNAHQFVVRRAGHSVAGRLKQCGLLGQLVREALDGRTNDMVRTLRLARQRLLAAAQELTGAEGGMPGEERGEAQ